MANGPETAEQRGQSIVSDSRRDLVKAAEAINREISIHSNDATYKKEFLQSAGTALQREGLLPLMAANFGLENFSQLDSAADKKSKGQLTSEEVNIGLAANKSKYSPAEQLAGQYLSTTLTSDFDLSSNGGSVENLINYGRRESNSYSDYANGRLAAQLFGPGTKGFELTDANHDGYLSIDEMNRKAAVNSALKEFTNLKPGKEAVLDQENHALRWLSNLDVRRAVEPYHPEYISAQGIVKYSQMHEYPRWTTRPFVLNAEKID